MTPHPPSFPLIPHSTHVSHPPPVSENRSIFHPARTMYTSSSLNLLPDPSFVHRRTCEIYPQLVHPFLIYTCSPPFKKIKRNTQAMALTEPQISSLLGYIAEPIQNKVSEKNHADLKEIMLVFKEVDAQRNLQMPSSIEQRWIDFLPWHSFN